MRLLSWRLFVPLLALAAFLAVACGGDEEEPAPDTGATDGTATATATADATGAAATGTPAAQAPDDLEANQVLRTNLESEPTTLDPQRATDTVSVSVLRQLYEGLLWLDPTTQEVVPALAAEVPSVENGGISEDGLTYTFKLNPDAKWSDGEPVTAQNVVDGVKRLFEPGTGNYYVQFYRVIAAGGANVEAEEAAAAGVEGAEFEAIEQKVVDQLEVTAVDEHTVEFKLNRVSPVFLQLTTMWPVYPVRADLIEQHGDQWTEAGNLVGNGPFVLAEWNHNENIVLERNENYAGEPAKLARIEMDMIPDTGIAFLAYQEDELDVVKLGPAELVQVRENTELQDEFQAYAQLVTLGVYLHNEKAPLDNVLVRKAIMAALDREELTQVVLEGAALPAFSWVPPGMPGHQPEVGLEYQDAKEQAQQWMEESGVDPSTVDIEYLSSDTSTSQLVAQWVKEQLEGTLGVTVTIRTLDSATYFDERNAGNFEMVGGGWGADYPDPQNWMPLFVCGAPLNAGKFCNEQYDQLVTEAETELDNERRLELYAQAQEILVEEVGFVPLYYRNRTVLAKPWVQGIVFSSMEHTQPGDLSFDQVFIEGREG